MAKDMAEQFSCFWKAFRYEAHHGRLAELGLAKRQAISRWRRNFGKLLVIHCECNLRPVRPVRFGNQCALRFAASFSQESQSHSVMRNTRYSMIWRRIKFDRLQNFVIRFWLNRLNHSGIKRIRLLFMHSVLTDANGIRWSNPDSFPVAFR